MLVNLGSPAAPSAPAVRRYLAEFLSDPRVVDLPRALWLPLLYGIILPLRSGKSAALYRRVWTPDGAPLLAISASQARALGARLGPDWCVRAAMRYGAPSIAQVLAELVGQGIGRLVVLPMFPQHANATVGSVHAAVTAECARHQPDLPLSIVPPHPVHEGYIAALAACCRQAAGTERFDHTVFSFHGLPQSQVDRGDPYRDQCAATAQALADTLELTPADWSLAFQSRFGPAAWLQPYTDVLVRSLAERAPRLLVACPGFTADCLETLDEIGTVLAADFRRVGGKELRLVPALNDSPLWIEALERMVRESVGTETK
jgi:ferrochelatase